MACRLSSTKMYLRTCAASSASRRTSSTSSAAAAAIGAVRQEARTVDGEDPTRGGGRQIAVDFSRWPPLSAGINSAVRRPSARLKHEAADFEVRELLLDGTVASLEPFDEATVPSRSSSRTDCASPFDDGLSRYEEVLREERRAFGGMTEVEIENRIERWCTPGAPPDEVDATWSSGHRLVIATLTEVGRGRSEIEDRTAAATLFTRMARLRGALQGKFAHLSLTTQGRLEKARRAGDDQLFPSRGRITLVRNMKLLAALGNHFAEDDHRRILRFLDRGFGTGTLLGNGGDEADAEVAARSAQRALRAAGVPELLVEPKFSNADTNPRSAAGHPLLLHWAVHASLPECFLGPKVRLQIWKRELSGTWLWPKLERELKLPPGAIRTGGTKDKKAVTCQFAEIPLPCLQCASDFPNEVARIRAAVARVAHDAPPDPEAPRSRGRLVSARRRRQDRTLEVKSTSHRLPRLCVGDFRFLVSGCQPQPVRPDAKISEANEASEIAWGRTGGNRFRVRLRGVSDLGSLLENCERVKKHGFANYFGPQRFGVLDDNGRSCQNLEIGLAILHRNWRAAVDRWLAGFLSPGEEGPGSGSGRLGVVKEMIDVNEEDRDPARSRARRMLRAARQGESSEEGASKLSADFYRRVLKTTASRQLLSLWVLSVASYLWNEVAAARIIQQQLPAASSEKTSTLLWVVGSPPRQKRAKADRCRSSSSGDDYRSQSTTTSSTGSESELDEVEHQLQQIYDPLLHEWGLTLQDFDLTEELGISLPPRQRALVERGQGLEVEIAVAPAKGNNATEGEGEGGGAAAVLTFSLPPGTYATSLLREVAEC